MKIDETFEKENINPIVGYIFNSAKQLGLENAPNELDWRYLTEGTRRIRKLLEQTARAASVSRKEIVEEAFNKLDKLLIERLPNLTDVDTCSEAMDAVLAELEAKK